VTEKTNQQQIDFLTEKIADIKAQWPAHSVKPWMLQQLEDLEEELAQLKAKNETNENDYPKHES